MQQKIQAFRDLAREVASQLVDKLCGEFEREVNQLYIDAEGHRKELARCSQFIGNHLDRERHLHEMLGNMIAHHATVVESVQSLAQQPLDNHRLQEMLEYMCGQHTNILNSALEGVVAQQNAANVLQQQRDLASAEVEFSKIALSWEDPSFQRSVDCMDSPSPVRANGRSSLKFSPVAKIVELLPHNKVARQQQDFRSGESRSPACCELNESIIAEAAAEFAVSMQSMTKGNDAGQQKLLDKFDVHL
jgi:hypothetical protein